MKKIIAEIPDELMKRLKLEAIEKNTTLRAIVINNLTREICDYCHKNETNTKELLGFSICSDCHFNIKTADKMEKKYAEL